MAQDIIFLAVTGDKHNGEVHYLGGLEDARASFTNQWSSAAPDDVELQKRLDEVDKAATVDEFLKLSASVEEAFDKYWDWDFYRDFTAYEPLDSNGEKREYILVTPEDTRFEFLSEGGLREELEEMSDGEDLDEVMSSLNSINEFLYEHSDWEQYVDVAP